MANRNDLCRPSRRALLGTLGGSVALLVAARGGVLTASPTDAKPRTTIRDHLWIFTVTAGSDDNWYEEGGVRGGSRMTPAEGAFYLNVPNLILVRNQDCPSLPDQESWRTKTSFEQYALSFRPLERVVWSVVGSGGKGGLEELGPVLQLAEKYPNISGIYLDDFIVDARLRDGKNIGRPALAPADLQRARDRMKVLRRRMEVWVTLYSHELLPQRWSTELRSVPCCLNS
jgi:hypothetical protein